MNKSQTTLFDSNKSTRTNLFLKLVSLLSLILMYNSSHFIIREKKEGIVKTNVCNVPVLSSYLSLIPKDKQRTAFEAEDDILSICPSLKYSCCHAKEINFWINEINSAFKFLDSRHQIMKAFYKRLKILAKETFNLFLAQLTSEDIQCYNKLVKKKNEMKKYALRDFPDLTKELDANLKKNLFNRESFKNFFEEVKNSIGMYHNHLEKETKQKKTYYTSMLCTICSPSFNKFFQIDDEGEPVITVNKKHCQSLINQRVDSITNYKNLKFLQKITDIVYCARKHSRKDKDYGEFNWHELNFFYISIPLVNKFIREIGFCASNPNNFFLLQNNGNNCLEACRKSMALFQIERYTLNPMI